MPAIVLYTVVKSQALFLYAQELMASGGGGGAAMSEANQGEDNLVYTWCFRSAGAPHWQQETIGHSED